MSPDDIETDEGFNQLMGLLALDIRRRVVRGLLGTDRPCFTTREYKEAYEREAWKTPHKVFWSTPEIPDLAVQHLLSVPELVYRPVESIGIWFRVIPGRRQPCLPSTSSRPE